METPDMYYMCSHDLYRSMYNPQTCTSQGTAIDPEKKVTCTLGQPTYGESSKKMFSNFYKQ